MLLMCGITPNKARIQPKYCKSTLPNCCWKMYLILIVSPAEVVGSRVLLLSIGGALDGSVGGSFVRLMGGQGG